MEILKQGVLDDLFEEDNNQCIIEVLYTEHGFKFPEPFEKLTISSYLRPAKESLDRLINDKQNDKNLQQIILPHQVFDFLEVPLLFLYYYYNYQQHLE